VEGLVEAVALLDPLDHTRIDGAIRTAGDELGRVTRQREQQEEQEREREEDGRDDEEDPTKCVARHAAAPEALGGAAAPPKTSRCGCRIRP
jgi:hypothetical protein